EVLVEPRAPDRAHRIARLQHRPHPRAGTAAHEAEMPAVLAGHQLQDGIDLAVPTHAEHDPRIGPLHAPTPSWTFSPSEIPIPSRDSARDPRPSARELSRIETNARELQSLRRFPGAPWLRSP